MSFKVLTKIGVDSTNIDGARGEHFNAGMRDGIVKGALNEGTFGANSSNSIFLDSCELRISGHRIVINEPVYKAFENAPVSNVRYAYVAQIIVDDSSNVDFSLLVQSANIKLIQDNLFKTTNGKGTYQIEIGRFTLKTDGTITDVVRTTDIITGGAWQGTAINVGNVTTNVIDLKLPAEVDIDQRYDADEAKPYLDFEFNLPIDLTGVDEAAKAAYDNAASALSTSNEANERSKTAETTANDAKTVAGQANTKSDTATTTANNANTKSDTALTNSQTAVTNSNSALEKANTAISNSNEAKTTAANAETVSNGIDAKATEALTNSQTAINSSNSANTKSDTAVTTANTANTTANQAKQLAEQASNEIANITSLLPTAIDISGGA